MKIAPEKRLNETFSISGEKSQQTKVGQETTNGKFKPNASSDLPERYTIKANGQEKILTCLEAPNLNVHIEKALTFSSAVTKKSPAGTIFLDGVAQCEPFMDHERRIYNMDHHEGCVRAFTLSTCEQALVMCLKGLDLQGREWNIFANEPDLDTLLAIWVILNHARIAKQDANQRRLLFSLIRYEGVIDALGLELKELSALSPELMRKMQRVIDYLRTDEIALKKENRWFDIDYLKYTQSLLHKIDQLFYKPSDFIDYQGLEELARIDLTEKRIAAVVEASMGIYEIEPHLNKLYGNQLGIVFLKKGPNSYTVRKMDIFMPTPLACIYDRLNFVDAAVRYRTFGNKWGGAADIGGSPRETGTHLTPLEIMHACREAVRKPNWLQKMQRFGTTMALAGFIIGCAYLVSLIWAPGDWLEIAHLAPILSSPIFGFALTLLFGSGIGLTIVAYHRPWQYGWTLPVGASWWLLLPVAIVSGVAGGLWAPGDMIDKEDWATVIVLGIVTIPLAVEILFRSLVHGLLAQWATIQRHDTPWFLSWPAVGNSLLYLGFWYILIRYVHPEPLILEPAMFLLALASAILLSLTASMVRERSQSVQPAIFFHMLAAAAAFISHIFL